MLDLNNQDRFCPCPEADEFRTHFVHSIGMTCFKCKLEVRMDYQDIVEHELYLILKRVKR